MLFPVEVYTSPPNLSVDIPSLVPQIGKSQLLTHHSSSIFPHSQACNTTSCWLVVPSNCLWCQKFNFFITNSSTYGHCLHHIWCTDEVDCFVVYPTQCYEVVIHVDSTHWMSMWYCFTSFGMNKMLLGNNSQLGRILPWQNTLRILFCFVMFSLIWIFWSILCVDSNIVH